MEDLLSVEEAARRLGGISKWTVHGWLSKGKLKRTKVGRRTMILESELQRVIRHGAKSPSPSRKSSPQPVGVTKIASSSETRSGQVALGVRGGGTAGNKQTKSLPPTQVRKTNSEEGAP